MHLEPVWLLEALGAPIPTERCFRWRLTYPLRIGATDTCGSTCRRFTSSALATGRLVVDGPIMAADEIIAQKKDLHC